MYYANKIKILVPRLHNMGGVANYYKVLEEYLDSNYEYIFRGNASRDESMFAIPWRMLKDYALFCKKTRTNVKAIVINSSLGIGGFFRDGLYFFLAPRKPGKVVFFRGWDPGFEKRIDGSVGLKAWMNKTFLRADHIIVLSSEFEGTLRHWGYTGPVSLETTIVSEKLVQDDDFQNLSRARAENENPTLLYLGNISKDKGVKEVVQAYQILNEQTDLKGLKCVMAGEGGMLKELKNRVAGQKLDIQFPGYVRDGQKRATFKNAHVYVFPSAHEGMPTSVLEAIAFGLPVITTKVGGLPDFFEDGRMGLFLDNQKPAHIAEKIRYLLDRPSLILQISEYNYNYAKNHFYSSQVARRFKKIVESVI